ncbi:hypothetical protein FH972_024955 [Carpinus fangiana]|uniref:Uncharacterized protein n=1 Tax=Carpinus fangiana TaxID=176857 RepID=A0A5N6L243_9ROSI|nr:hypothetical protein FH972_024955 [Carpinus fangiana]
MAADQTSYSGHTDLPVQQHQLAEMSGATRGLLVRHCLGCWFQRSRFTPCENVFDQNKYKKLLQPTHQDLVPTDQIDKGVTSVQTFNMVHPNSIFYALALAATSPSASAAVSHATLQGMTLWGYQGWYAGNTKWFQPPQDIAGPPTNQQQVLTDYIPFVDDYPSNCWEPTNFVLANGSNAHWFYSNCSAVVEKHFQYMVKYGIDGILLQRFGVATFPNNPAYALGIQILNLVRQYAEKYKKYFAIEYDYSGLANNTAVSFYYPNFQADWDNVLTPLFNSSSYIYQNGKPAVAIYGAGFSTSGGTGAAFQQMWDYMSNSTAPPWKILGVPWYWQSYKPGSGNADPENMWALYKNMDCILPWGVGAYDDPASFKNYYAGSLKSGKATADSLGIKFAPVIHPGTENFNAAYNATKGGPRGPFGYGRFNTTTLQYSLGNVSSVDLKPHFIMGAMFDEYTEGSQILPALAWNQLPPNPNPGFAGYDSGVDPYIYMNISGNWSTAFHRVWGQTPP